MRRALLSEWPALSVRFGLHPWDVGGPRDLTIAETDAYVRASREWTRQEREQQAQQGEVTRWPVSGR